MATNGSTLYRTQMERVETVAGESTARYIFADCRASAKYSKLYKIVNSWNCVLKFCIIMEVKLLERELSFSLSEKRIIHRLCTVQKRLLWIVKLHFFYFPRFYEKCKTLVYFYHEIVVLRKVIYWNCHYFRKTIKTSRQLRRHIRNADNCSFPVRNHRISPAYANGEYRMKRGMRWNFISRRVALRSPRGEEKKSAGGRKLQEARVTRLTFRDFPRSLTAEVKSRDRLYATWETANFVFNFCLSSRLACSTRNYNNFLLCLYSASTQIPLFYYSVRSWNFSRELKYNVVIIFVRYRTRGSEVIRKIRLSRFSCAQRLGGQVALSQYVTCIRKINDNSPGTLRGA